MPIKLLSLSVCAFLLNILSNNCIAAAAGAAPAKATTFNSLSPGEIRIISQFLTDDEASAFSMVNKKTEESQIAPIVKKLSEIWENKKGADYENMQVALNMIVKRRLEPETLKKVIKAYLNSKYRPVVVLPFYIELKILEQYPGLIAGYKKVNIEDFRDVRMEETTRVYIQAYLALFNIYAHEDYYSPDNATQKNKLYNELRRKVTPGPRTDDVKPAIISVNEYLERPAVDTARAVYLTKIDLTRLKGDISSKALSRIYGQDVVDEEADSKEGPLLKPIMDTFILNLAEGVGASGKRIIKLTGSNIPKGIISLTLMATDSDAELSIADNFMSLTNKNFPLILDLSPLKNVKDIGNDFLSYTTITNLNMPFKDLETIGDDFMALTSYKPSSHVIFPSFSKLKSVGNGFLMGTGYSALDLSKATSLKHIGRDFCALSKIVVANLSGFSSLKDTGKGFFRDTHQLKNVLFMSSNTKTLLDALGDQVPFFRKKKEGWFTSKPILRIVFDLPVEKAGDPEFPPLTSYQSARAAWTEKLRPLSENVTINYENTEYPFSEKLIRDAWEGSARIANNVYNTSSQFFTSTLKELSNAQEALTSATFTMHGGDPGEE